MTLSDYVGPACIPPHKARIQALHQPLVLACRADALVCAQCFRFVGSIEQQLQHRLLGDAVDTSAGAAQSPVLSAHGKGTCSSFYRYGVCRRCHHAVRLQALPMKDIHKVHDQLVGPAVVMPPIQQGTAVGTDAAMADTEQQVRRQLRHLRRQRQVQRQRRRQVQMQHLLRPQPRRPQ
jgi:hypothetical protein